ncbi:hypothetical protein EVAR_76865_1 [Eumeta japonica]|uniref:Uncharacterized protein n=1 Tax=Eumeta variegata TaxID=151549 RepID=A0A4C1SEF2_EUMVA|nr:hypothetical protein EVAR_76865_1 [Eumeta japonica]
MTTEWYPRDGIRNKGRQTKRWEDEVRAVAGPEWIRLAKDRETMLTPPTEANFNSIEPREKLVLYNINTK